MEITLNYTDEAGNVQQCTVSGSLPFIEFIKEIDYMIKLYGNQKYTKAEAQRDKLAEKLDDIMRVGGYYR
jgi:hypothetical protein